MLQFFPLVHNQDHDMYILPRCLCCLYEPEVLLVSSLRRLIQAYLDLCRDRRNSTHSHDTLKLLRVAAYVGHSGATDTGTQPQLSAS